MNDRRRFLRSSLLSAAALALPAGASTGAGAKARGAKSVRTALRPRVVSTWDFGVGANQAAWHRLQAGGSALDAGFGLYKGFVHAVCDAQRQDALLEAGSVYATAGE